MSFQDDTCDFCGRYIDGMGNDVKSVEHIDGQPKYWDGQCLEGMEALWGSWTLGALTALQRTHQDAYDADPIDPEWSKPEHDSMTESQRFQLRVKQCTHMDRAWQLARYLEHRRQQESAASP